MKPRRSKVGSSFEDFLREEGQFDAADTTATKRVFAWQIAKVMKREKLSKTALAERIGTSRAQLDRLLDPTNSAVTVDSLIRVATALGKRLRIELAA